MLFGRKPPAVAPTKQAPTPPIAPFLHTNGCGDFTLLARSAWEDLRGYPEFPIFSMNIDSLFCFTAVAAGLQEVELTTPMRVYHIEHGTGSGWSPSGEAALRARIARSGIPWLENPTVMHWAAQMTAFNTPMIFSPADWGLAQLPLPEHSVTPSLNP